MQLREVVRQYLPALQQATGCGVAKVLYTGAAPHYADVGVLHAHGLVNECGEITERGLAALDTIRREHPLASPNVFYRDVPADW